MDDPLRLSPAGRGLLDRRSFLGLGGGALGALPLLSLLAGDGLLAGEGRRAGPVRPAIDPERPYAPRPPHHPAKAKRLLIVFCVGAVSHIDTFDHKPELTRAHGQKPAGVPEVTFEGPSGAIARPFWEFRPRGRCGKMVSDLLPHLGALVDDCCFLHALHSITSAHPAAESFLATGSTGEGHPSLGAWTTYALGTANQELPAFVAIADPRGWPRAGRTAWGSGFLPGAFQGTDFSTTRPPVHLARPAGIAAEADRRAFGLLRRLNARHLERFPGDADLAARIASYELAGRLQTSIPEVMAIDGEPPAALRAYGAEDGTPTRRAYARNCILARRLLERGVRVVQLFCGADASGGNGVANWDSHSGIAASHAAQAEIMDQPTAALIADLAQRGLLADTLVVWCTEFGRAPFLQANGTGRDHNPDAFTCFLAGAGVRAGTSYGASDEWGFKAAERPTSLYDFNATILHLLGLDHERLTFYHNGIERRLTNVHGQVLREVLT